MIVTALLVSHGGARWLPAVLEGLSAQTRPVDRHLAVDTGSKDDSPALLRAALGDDRVLTAPRSTPFGDAVRLGLDALGPAGPARPGGDGSPEEEWVWLLHDDANPAPGALAALLTAAEEHPDADVLGPKLREWPSLGRLLELGVTISGTGRRETGLEHGEYDQGQHDEVRTVLAVNTAGMLVRRRLLDELGGFDAQLPVFGNDVDFGWRAAWAGRRTIVVPSAVVFHAEAAHRGQRRTPLTGRHTHYQERRAALWTLLVNGERRGLPWRLLRLAVGSLLRAVGLLLGRQVGPALDELAAVGSVYGRPGRVLAARRARAVTRTAAPQAVRALLAPWWVPYRHGLDAVADLVSALTSQAQDVAERRRAAAYAADAGLPARDREAHVLDGDDDEVPAPDTGWAARLLTSPVALGLVAFVVLGLVATRDAWGRVSGGGLPPVPESVDDWWRLYAESWHPLAQGTDAPAPAYLPVLAGAGQLLGGPGAAVTALLVLSLPVACWGAWRMLRVAGHLADPLGAPRWLLAWGATSYAMLPATSGLWGDGRFGTLAAATALPWLAHAALGFADPDPDRRWRAAWRTGLLLALTTAFAPVAWPFAVLLLAVVVGAGWALLRTRPRPAVVGPPLVALAVAPVLLLPWWLPLVLHGRTGGLLLDPGLLPPPSVSGVDLLLGTASAYAAPFLPAALLLVLGLAALVPGSTRLQVLVCWLVALVAAVAALLLSLVPVELGSVTTGPGLGLFVVLLPAPAIVAVVIAGTDAARRLVRGAVPRLAGGLAAAALVAVPAVSGLWFATLADDALAPTGDEGIPAYMEQSALLGPAHGVLVLDGALDSGLDYTVRRGDGPTVGEPEILALTAPEAGMTASMQRLLSRPSATLVGGLADRGIEYVVLRGPADPDVAAILDSAPGLSQASAEDRSTRAWLVERELSADALAGPDGRTRTVLLVAQGVALALVLLLCLPSTTRSEDS